MKAVVARALRRFALASSFVAAACARPDARSPRRVADGWAYAVTAGEGARELSVEATFGRGSPEELSVDTGAEPYVRDVAVFENGVWKPIPPRGTSWFAPSCRTEGCRVRYRFLLADAARTVDDVDRAIAPDGAWLAPPSTWLLHPLFPDGSAPVRVDVATPPDVRFVTGLVASGSSFVLDASDMPDSPYSGFGAFRTTTLRIAGGTIDVAIGPGKIALGDREILDWIHTSGVAVSDYYGRFPVPRVLVMIAPQDGHGVFGKTLGNGGASILVQYGRDSTVDELAKDWIMPHEMIHLAFPSVPRSHVWIEEGLSTYVEPIARARRGLVSEADVWRDFVLGLPNGLPEPDDRGLDFTPTWGRTYWGGALFCLAADLAIRERTDNRKSLDDALRAIVAAGGDVYVRWPLERALDVGDQALGIPVLHETYDRMGRAPGSLDLAKLWADLGVRLRGRQVIFDDGARLAWVRKAITAP